MSRPLAVDLFSGLGGWTTGLTAAGWYVIRFDLEDMCRLLNEPQPEHSSLVIQDVLTIHGKQFKDVGLIVSSSPCQEFSYRAMPWKLSKAKSPEQVGLPEPHWWRKKSMSPAEYAQWLAWKEMHPIAPPELGMKLFHAQFRIQREACEAAGRHIPMVCENVRGAQPWVGRARWNFGSYFLFGDVPALMPATVSRKNTGDSWFNIGSPGQTVVNQNPVHDGRKIAGFRFDGSGRSFQSAAVGAHEGVKNPGRSLSVGAARFNDRIANFRKGVGAGAVRFDQNTSSLPSASPRRKAASAKIAKIPLALSTWIGEVYLPL